MQTIGPYRLVQALGECPVGGVWSAVDAEHKVATVAVLTTAAAHDPGWRNAFAATANSLAQSGEVPLIAGDYSGPTPWIASAARDGSVLGRVFIALGMDFQASGPDGPGPESASEAPTGLANGSPRAPSHAAEPVAGQPQPVSGAPAQGTATVSSGSPYQSAAGYPYESTPGGGSPHTVSPFSVPPAGPPPRRGNAALVGVSALILGVLVGGGGVFAFGLLSDEDEPQVQQSTEPTVPVEPTLAPPSQPGVEPPLDGEWPVGWPTFARDEPYNEIAGLLADSGRAFRVPEGWECSTVAEQGTFGHYTCGPGGDPAEVGGDLIVRLCPDPCDLEQRDAMRAEVEAWGLRWNHAAGPQYWAETSEVDGEERYGLVVTAYYRTTAEGRIDRQVILRMTAPVDQADEIRKIANSVHNAVT